MPALRSNLPLLALLASLAACAPVVTHGPRVKPGPEYGMVLGWRQRGCDSCGAGLVPPIGTTMRYGWLPRGTEGPGLSIGAMVPGFIFIPSSTLDVYAQAPAREDQVVLGGGLSVSSLDVMPYVQAGRQDPGGGGWYTTQGIVLAAYRPEPEVFLNGGRGTVFEHVAAVYWSPTLAYHGRELTLYVSGAFGRQRPDEEGVVGPRRSVQVLMAGMALRPEDPVEDLLGWRRLPPRRRR